jgi:transcriptional regulator
MYHFSYFKEKDRQTILAFLEAHPFAFMTGCFNNGTQVATQVPMLTSERDGELYIQGHIMRNTDHHKAFIENPNVLLVFTGPSTYVSASWYSNSQMGSTWNYMSVHMHGNIHWMSSDELIQLMKTFTLKHEGGDSFSPTIYDNLPESYVNKMMAGITGFEMKVEKLDNVFKLSQNRDEKSYTNIISKLEAKGGESALIAEEMKKRKDNLFPPGQVWDGTKFDS